MLGGQTGHIRFHKTSYIVELRDGNFIQQEKIEKGSSLRQERRYGAFERTLSLPTTVVADQAKAEFEHGVLTLTLPKAEEVKPRSIKVKAK